MFTGIISDVGAIVSLEGEGDVRVAFSTVYQTDSIDIGASIACAGVCLTVVEKGEGWFSCDVSEETMRVTNLSQWKTGTEVNLERSLKLGEELGGHIVTGHVDTVGVISNFESENDSIRMDVSVPSSFGKFIAQKGSVAINGTSLTVNSVRDTADKTEFSINLIPHTQKVTSFRSASVGDLVNVEFDILARYVARLQDKG